MEIAKSLFTDITVIWLLSSVLTHMVLIVIQQIEWLWTVITLIRFLTCRKPVVILDFFLRVKWLGALWAFKLFLTTVLKSCASLNTNERKSTCCKLHIYMAWNRCKESSVAWDDLSYKSLFHSNHMASRFLCLNEMEQRSTSQGCLNLNHVLFIMELAQVSSSFSLLSAPHSSKLD